MYDSVFYKSLSEHSDIQADIIEAALCHFTQDEVLDLWNLFYNDSLNDRIPYCQGGFYPAAFYDAVYKMAMSKSICCNTAFLYIYLAFAQKSYDLYRQRKLAEGVFFDSFKRIGEDTREYLKENGVEGMYDYHFTANHVIGSIIRLGSFEYGYGKFNGKKAIYVHVPQCACMERQQREKSYALARRYFGKYPIIADSWILYPEHRHMLSQDSLILDFAKDYDIVSVNESRDYNELFHIFGRNADYSKPDALPHDTLLQKKYVERIKEKQPIGSAVGVLKNTNHSI